MSENNDLEVGALDETQAAEPAVETPEAAPEEAAPEEVAPEAAPGGDVLPEDAEPVA